MPGSPALDAGDDTLTGTDQRGRPRRSGTHVDIGAYEFCLPTPLQPTALRNQTNGSVQFCFSIVSDTPCNVLATTNVTLPAAQWLNLGPATPVSVGLYRFTDPTVTNVVNGGRFYRLRSP